MFPGGGTLFCFQVPGKRVCTVCCGDKLSGCDMY